MLYKMSLTWENFLASDIICHKSNARFWSVLEGVFETSKIFEALRLIETVEADITTMKTLRTKDSEVADTEEKVDNKSSLHAFLGFSPKKWLF